MAKPRRPGVGAALALALALALTLKAPLVAAQPEQQTIRGWRAYIAAAENRMRHELDGGTRFLALDFDSNAAAERRRIVNGQIAIRRAAFGTEDGEQAPQVPDATVEDWQGAIFIPAISVPELLRDLYDHVPPSPDVLRAEVLSRTPDGLHVFLRVQRTRIVTVVYNTEHDVKFRLLDPTHATSTSFATRISEMDRPGTANERALPPGEDHGYLWRLSAYWRYEAVQSGVIAECESISLSRSVPFLLRPVAAPLINGTARAALEQTLLALRTDAAGRRQRRPPAQSPVR